MPQCVPRGSLKHSRQTCKWILILYNVNVCKSHDEIRERQKMFVQKKMILSDKKQKRTLSH